MSKVLAPTRFLFVRHAQTLWNGEHRYAGSSEVPLAPEAVEQIKAVTSYLKHEHIDAIYSSPLSRCISTITPTAHAHHLRIIIRPELIERNLGTWEGKIASEIHVTHAGYHFPMSAYNGDFRVPEAEPLEEVEKRLRHLLHELHETHPGQTVALATHAGVIWSIHSHVVKNPPPKIQWAGNCSLAFVITEAGHFLDEGMLTLEEMHQELVHFSQPILSK